MSKKLSEMFKELDHPPITPKPVIKIETLTPPPKPVIESNDIEDQQSFINRIFVSDAISSDSYRQKYRVITGKSWRGTNEGLIDALYKHYNEIKEFNEYKWDTPKIIKEVNEQYKRGTSLDKKALINELKQVLEDKKNKIPELN